MKKTLCLLLTVLMVFFILPPTIHAEKTAETARYTVLVLDTSGTQNFYSSGTLIYTADSAISYVKQASTKFVNDVLTSAGNNKIAVVEFNSAASIVSAFSDNANEISSEIKALSSNNSSCCIAGGLEKAEALLSEITTENADKNIVLVTTGFTNSGQSSYAGHYSSDTIGSNWQNMATNINLYAYANIAYKTAETIKEDTTIYTLGLFQTMDDMPKAGENIASFFKLTTMDLATSPTHFYEVDDPNNLGFTFDEIVDSIINPLQLELSYNYVNMHPKTNNEEEYVEIHIVAKIINASGKDSINTLVKLKETPGLKLAPNEMLEHNLETIPANDSRETSWKIHAATPNGEKEYLQSIVVGSENSVAVENTLLIKITGALEVMNYSDSDRWSFSHNSVGNYTIDSDSLEYLLSYYNKTESDRLRTLYDALLAEKWSGSCHGMSIGAFLFKSNRLTPKYWDFRFDRGDASDKQHDAETISELDIREARSLINYYFLMQFGPEHRNIFDATIKNGDAKNIEKIVFLVQKNAVLFGFNWESEYTKNVWLANGKKRKKGEKEPHGHTIILYGNPGHNDEGWNINGKIYKNRIKAYDINYMTDSGDVYFYYEQSNWTLGCENDNQITECYFSSDYEKLRTKTINFVTNDVRAIDYRNIESQNIEDRMQKNSLAYFTANNLTNKIRIMDKTGKYVDIDGLVTDGTLDCITYYNNMVLEDASLFPSLNIAFKTADAYTVSNTENIKELNLNVLYENIGINSKVSNASEITYDPLGKVNFYGDSSNFNLSLVANDGFYSTPWYKTIVSGDNAAHFAMEQVENGVLLEGDHLVDINITTINDSEKSQVISTDTDKLFITYNANDEQIIMYDSDGDGIFDKELFTYKLTMQAKTGGEIISNPIGTYSENATIEIEAVEHEGYVFTHWTSSHGGKFENARELKTKFTMPSNDTTITANFRKELPFGNILSYLESFRETVLSWLEWLYHLIINIQMWFIDIITFKMY